MRPVRKRPTKADPSGTVLTELRKEGFQPFIVTHTRTRHEDRHDYTKHMIRLRHASQINARGKANEIILLNSHDSTSSYRSVFPNMVCAPNTVFVGPPP